MALRTLFHVFVIQLVYSDNKSSWSLDVLARYCNDNRALAVSGTLRLSPFLVSCRRKIKRIGLGAYLFLAMGVFVCCVSSYSGNQYLQLFSYMHLVSFT